MITLIGPANARMDFGLGKVAPPCAESLGMLSLIQPYVRGRVNTLNTLSCPLILARTPGSLPRLPGGHRTSTRQAVVGSEAATGVNHPQGGCLLARHGTYARKTPAGTQIAGWYCRESYTTFHLLPDCLAARLPGTLSELEAVVAEAEHARSLMAVADQVRRDAVELPGAMRWVRRRVRLVHHAVRLVIGLLPLQLSGCQAEITACRPAASGWTERCGAGVAAFADRAVAPCPGRSARIPSPRHRR